MITSIRIFVSTIGAACFLPAMIAGAQTCADIPGSMVSWWRGENSAADVTAFRNGTLLNGAAFAAGKAGQAFSLDGINDFVDVPHANAFNPAGAFSVEAWINAHPSQLSGDGLFVIADKSHGYTDNTGWFLQGTVTETIGFGFGNGSSFTQATTTSIVTDGLWHHVIGVYTGSELRIYYDGILQGTAVASGAPAGNTRNVAIGRAWGGGTPARHFRGKVDELTFYGSALTAAEVSAIFTAGAAGKCLDHPYFVTRTLADGRVTVPYYRKLEVTLTPAPYTFQVIAGSLPAGMNLTSAGVLLGTPTTAGTSNFTVRATDSLGVSSDQAFTMLVDNLACVPIPPGMVAWWRGEGNALDELGRRHGTLSGDVTFEPGRVGQAFRVRVGGNIEIPHDEELSIAAGDAMSIEFWMKTAQVNGTPRLVEKRIHPVDDGTANYVLYINVVNIGWGPASWAYSAGEAVNWHHVAVTRDGTEFKIYVNGQLGQTAQGTMNGENAAPLTLGRFQGWLDEVAFYNRALTAAEVSALHAAAGGKCEDQLMFPPGALRPGKVSVPYRQLLGAGVTSGPVEFSLVSGALPPGLELLEDGSIEGTPVTPGTHPLRFRVADAFGNAAEKDYTITIADCVGGPVAWWPADGNLRDAVGTNHGSGSPSFTDDGHGGTAFYGAGQNQWVTIPHSEDLSFSPTTPMTVEFRGNTGVSHHLISKGGSDFNYRLFPGTAPASLQWGGTGGGGAQSAGGIWQFNNSYWSHIVVTFDGTISKIYVDGVRSGTSTLGPLGPENTEPLQLMRRPGEYNGNVVMDDVAIYDHAMSAAEVAALYVSASMGEGRCGALYIATTSPMSAAGQQLPFSQPVQAMLGLPPYTFSVAEGSLPGGLSLSPSGVLSGTPTGYGAHRFTLNVTDSAGHEATRKFGMDINGKPSPPAQENRTLNELTALTVNHAGTDPYPPGNTLTYTLVDPPAGAAIDAAGTITWTPAEDQGPAVHTMTVQTTDNGTPPLTAVSSFTVTVNEVNAAPQLPVQGDHSMDELTPLTVSNAATDSDLPGNALTYTLVDPPAGAAISSSGVITWTPAETQGPGVYTLTTTVNDNTAPNLSATNTFTVTVNDVNSAPVLPVSADRILDEMTTLTVTDTAADSDAPANALTYELLTAPPGASIDPAGVIAWTPTEAQGPGMHPFTVKVTDNGTPALSATHSFTVTVNEVNTAPGLSVKADRAIDELTPLTVANPATDADAPANALTYSLINPPEGAAIDAAGVITWTPSEAQGPGPFTITTMVADNGTPALSTTNSFVVTVNELNAAPTLSIQTDRTIDELMPLSMPNGATDTDLPANNLTYTLLEAPPGAAIDSTGLITWTPTEAQGPGVFTFTTRVNDNGTPDKTATNTFTVTVNDVNSAPVLPEQADRTINELTPLSVNDGATDTDLPANALTYQLLTAPPGAVMNAAGVITWTPTEAQGPGVHTFTVLVMDDGTPAMSVTHSFFVFVEEVNTAPALSTQADAIIDELTPLARANPATDADAPVNGLTYSLVNPPAGAAIDGNGTITWTPTELQGPGSFAITTRVTDDGTPALHATNTFTVTVNEVNAAPVLPAQSGRTINELVTLSVTNTATDADRPANVLAYTLQESPPGAVISATGVITWTPTESHGPGTYTFTTRVTDNGSPGKTAENTFTVTVSEVNSAPLLAPLANRTINPGQTVSFTAVATDSDLPANDLSFSLVNPPAGATIHPATGLFHWRPELALAASGHSLTVRVTDNGTPELSHTRTFTVSVNAMQPVSFETAGVTGNTVSLRVDGPVGPDYTVQWSDNLSNWESLPTQTPGTMPLTVTDSVGPGIRRRFYRLLLGP